MSTQLKKSLYIEYAEALDLMIRDSIEAASDPLYAALTAVVDIVESDYPAGVAADIEIALLSPTNIAWDNLESISSGYLWNIYEWRNCCKAINKYVIENDANYGVLSDTEILERWVNNLSWDSVFVPYYWERLSSKSGYTTTNWITGS